MAATIWTDPIVPASYFERTYLLPNVIDRPLYPTPEVLDASAVLKISGGGVKRPTSGIVFP